VRSDDDSDDPPEIAVALKYDRERDNAPRVIARGARRRARQIKELARKAGVPIVRNVPLAYALNRVEVGAEIPEALYDAVAEVLNYIYTLARGLKKAPLTKAPVNGAPRSARDHLLQAVNGRAKTRRCPGRGHCRPTRAGAFGSIPRPP
jgi:flagellar biosynthesis protein